MPSMIKIVKCRDGYGVMSLETTLHPIEMIMISGVDLEQRLIEHEPTYPFCRGKDFDRTRKFLKNETIYMQTDRKFYSSLSRCQLWIKDDDGEIYGVNIEHVVVIDEKIETLKIADEYVGRDQNEILGN